MQFEEVDDSDDEITLLGDELINEETILQETLELLGL